MLSRRPLASSKAVTQYAASSALRRRPLGGAERFLAFGRTAVTYFVGSMRASKAADWGFLYDAIDVAYFS